MEAIVQATPKLEGLSVHEIPVICKQFIAILRRINKVANKLTLSTGLEEFKANASFWNETHHFYWGFGAGHLWVKQRGNDERLIFVLL